MRITYRTIRGQYITWNRTRWEAEARLAQIEESEQLRLEAYPTYSGDSVFNEQAEAKAIRSALGI